MKNSTSLSYGSSLPMVFNVPGPCGSGELKDGQGDSGAGSTQVIEIPSLVKDGSSEVDGASLAGEMMKAGNAQHSTLNSRHSTEEEVDGECSAVAVVTVEEAAALALTSKQQIAIRELTLNETRVKAAEAAGVSRMQLYRWMNHDPAFKAAYNAWEQDVLATAKGQMKAATGDAMKTVLKAIRKGDAKLAWKLLESQGVTERPVVGSTDVEELKRREEFDAKKKEIEGKKERNWLKEEEMIHREVW